MATVDDWTPGFCTNCGSILPQLKMNGNVNCYTCRKEFPPSVFGKMEAEFNLYFNTPKSIKPKEKNETPVDGPIVEKRCKTCGNDKMYYSTLQLRSADEGQTVFYTCTKCSFKETENS